MPARYGPLDRALDQARRLEATIIEELVHARLSAGLSRTDISAATGLSPYEIGRIERRELRSLAFQDIARYGAGVGRVLAARLYPDGDPIRDRAHQRLLGRLRARIGPGPRWRTEVPLVGVSTDDRRAWDAVIDGHGCVDAVEAETRFHDGQATVRKVHLKLRDDRQVRHVVLLLAETRANRDALRVARDGLRDDLPLDSRTVLAALGAGDCPGANGIVVL